MLRHPSLRGRSRRPLAVLATVVLLVALAGCAPLADPSTGLTAVEITEMIEGTQRSLLTPLEVAEALALGGRATNVQRELLASRLVRHVVDWDLPIYDVTYSSGRYQVTTQPIPSADPDAIPLLRVVAVVVPQDPTDESFLRTIKTDDPIRVRGIAQEIRLRTVIVIAPAVLP